LKHFVTWVLGIVLQLWNALRSKPIKQKKQSQKQGDIYPLW